MGGLYAFLAAAAETLMRGRAARGSARARLRAATGHALAFRTWQDLSRNRGLDDRRAVELMSRFVSAAR